MRSFMILRIIFRKQRFSQCGWGEESGSRGAGIIVRVRCGTPGKYELYRRGLLCIFTILSAGLGMKIS